MIPVNQSIFGSENGDCLRAAVASVLELGIEDVPHFIAVCRGCKKPTCRDCHKWHYGFVDFMSELGFDITWTQDLSCLSHEGLFGEYHVVIYTYNKDTGHAVVAQGDRVIHDPNPHFKGSLIGERVSLLLDANVLVVSRRPPEGRPWPLLG